MLLVGARCERDSSATDQFKHEFIAWSKLQGQPVAMGGLTMACERDGERVIVPESWMSRMELDYGDAWASLRIIAFRRGVGLPTRVGEGCDAESSDDRLSGAPTTGGMWG